MATDSDRLSEYFGNGAAPRVIGSRLDPDGAIVSSEFNRGSWPSTAGAIRVDCRLTRHDGMYKIRDVIIDGLSMAVNGRAELEGVAERNGWQPRAILAVLRQETAVLFCANSLDHKERAAEELQCRGRHAGSANSQYRPTRYCPKPWRSSSLTRRKPAA